jgi:hypothetical protein
MPNNVTIMTKFRQDIGEYETVRTHSLVSGTGRTSCGIPFTRKKAWEWTSHPVDCMSCQNAAERLNGDN